MSAAGELFDVLGECGNGWLVAVRSGSVLDIGECFGEADGLHAAGERGGVLGGVAGAVELAALEVRDHERVGAQCARGGRGADVRFPRWTAARRSRRVREAVGRGRSW